MGMGTNGIQAIHESHNSTVQLKDKMLVPKH